MVTTRPSKNRVQSIQSLKVSLATVGGGSAQTKIVKLVGSEAEVVFQNIIPGRDYRLIVFGVSCQDVESYRCDRSRRVTKRYTVREVKIKDFGDNFIELDFDKASRHCDEIKLMYSTARAADGTVESAQR